MTDHTKRPTRRTVLATAAAAALAGCSGDSDDNETDSDNGTDDADPPEAIDAEGFDQPPVVQDPPDAVYKPTHRASIEMLPTIQAGDYMLLPHFSTPHQFWLMRGDETEEVRPTAQDSLHVMVAFWDAETGQQVPVDAGAQLQIRTDGDLVERVFPWPMVSQTMGFHFGDNIPLPEDGTYTVDVTMNPLDVRKTGSFEGRFEESHTATFEFEYSDDRRRQLRDGIEFISESEWGEPGALSPMGGGGMNGGMEMAMGPSSGLRAADEYPGQDLGTHTSDDARFVVRYLAESRLADGEGYLLVSPRTPYNRIPLPDVALSVEGAVDRELTQTLDGELGLHYGASVALSPGDEFDLVVDTPPQVARHQGYETAFLDMQPMPIEGPDR